MTNLEYTHLPHIKNDVSRIGLGTWAIGGNLWGGTNERESIDTIHRALDLGINFIDTAPAYGKGVSEKIVGQAIKEYGNRDQIIIATKFGLNQETDQTFRDSRKEFVRKELENSLRRLQVDYIDLYQAHWPDPHTSISDTAEVLNKMLLEGKIRAIGLSNYSVEQTKLFRQYASLHTSQFPFNLFESESEKTLIPYCLESGLVTIGYSPLCRGLLSGKMSKEREFKGDDLRKNMDPKFQEPHFSEYLACVEALTQWAKNKYRVPLNALAIRYGLDKGIKIILWGARKPAQLENIGSIFGWSLTKEDYFEIDTMIHQYVKNPIGPQFMSPPEREE